jgi:hypothetical protein
MSAVSDKPFFQCGEKPEIPPVLFLTPCGVGGIGKQDVPAL